MPNIHAPSAQVKAVELAHNATANGASANSADCQLFTRAMILVVATTSGASGVTVNVQDSADNSTFAAVANATTGAIGASLTGQAYVIDLNLEKRNRYINVILASVSGTVSVTAVALLFNSRYNAVAQQNTVVQVL